MAIDAGFFRSTPFIVGGIIALAIIGTGVASWAGVGAGLGSQFSDGCSAPTIHGSPLVATRTSAQTDATHRTITWLLDANGTQGGALAACHTSGSILVTESPDAQIHVIARLEGDASALDKIDAEAAFARDGNGIETAAWLARSASNGFSIHSSNGADFEIQLPNTGHYEARASVDSGSVELRGLLWGNVTATADSGRITMRDVDVAGNTSLAVDSGEIDYGATAVGPSELHASADSGTVTLALPQRADIGYDATGTADSGSVAIAIGETEQYVKEDNNVYAVTKDYASKPTKVRIVASVDSGQIAITAR